MFIICYLTLTSIFEKVSCIVEIGEGGGGGCEGGVIEIFNVSMCMTEKGFYT